ncbi:hypothetical protein HZR84_12105 [Hyphobacterium sp. CCMP332]|nr:hypothetical protein HZR84_12105 [Hyphobacterium sp. CCMP332]
MPKPKDYNQNVFINCPFDDKYFELLKTLLFTILYFKFNPRLALESSDSGLSRLEKITRLIQESRYAIHDISRLQAKSANEYFRLNMPFELGIDYGLRRFHPNYNDKRSLILESEKYDYMKAISDINGMDIKNHKDNPGQLIECIRSWFSETVGLRDLNGSEKVYSDFIDFNTDLFRTKMNKYAGTHNSTEAEKFASSEINELTIPDFIDEVKTWLK